MAKVPYSKLKCKTEDSIKQVQINGETIEIKQYLSIQNKLEIIGRVVELAHDEDYNYSNPVKLKVFTALEILFAYTNLTFTDKQREDLPKLYDAIASSGVLSTIQDNIPATELQVLYQGIKDTIESVYKYQNSIMGVLDILKTDYSNMKLDIDALKQNITDPEALGFIKDVIDLTKAN